MKWSSALSLATAAVVSAQSSSSSSSSLPPLEIVGNKFFYSNNASQFYIRGVAYQSDIANASAGQTFSDPLGDPEACKRDVKYLQALQTNVIRVYAVNTSLDHDECISTFADAGIYVLADLSEPGLSINRDDPSWDVALYNRYTSVVDDLQKHDNILGFFAGNEVTNNNTNTDASAFVKAAIRDTKAYIKAKGYRQIPLGYSSNDDADTRLPMAEYFTCGDDDVKADFYGFNNYEWCGDATFQSSGYAARTKEFSGLGVPLFFSEYGCNEVQPRKFTEVAAIYSSEMTDVWSGGIVYMYFEEANNYGLVTVDSSGDVSTLADFGYLSNELKSVSPTSANTGQNTATPVSCPASTGSDWRANTNLPPTPNAGNCQCISAASNCLVDDSVDVADYGALFGFLCGKIDCGGISANGTSGQYGSFSYCDPKDQLNFLLNLYYEQNGKNSQACDFSGSASINSSPSTQGVCKQVLSQAGSAGTGSVSASATGTFTGGSEASATGGSAAASGSAASGSSAASSTGKKSGADSVRGDAMKMASVAFGVVAAAVACIL